MSKNIIFGNNIGKSITTINNYKLICILIIPNNSIHSISHKMNIMIRFSCWEEKINLSILVLED